MLRKRRAIEASHRLGHKLCAPCQLEYRVRNTAPHAGELQIGSLPREISRSASIAKMTPEDQPAPLDGSDLHEPAEILPAEHGAVVT